MKKVEYREWFKKHKTGWNVKKGDHSILTGFGRFYLVVGFSKSGNCSEGLRKLGVPGTMNFRLSRDIWVIFTSRSRSTNDLFVTLLVSKILQCYGLQIHFGMERGIPVKI